MMKHLLLSPLLWQIFTAIVLMGFWNNVRNQRVVSAIGSIIGLGWATALFVGVWRYGLITVDAGNHPAPFGITFVADTLSALLVWLTSLAGLAISVFAGGSIHNNRLKFGFFPIYHLLLAGLTGAFLTGDIFNLYVWFEIIIISSFVLITLGGERRQLEGAVKYFTLNMLASIIFLTGIAVLYGITGTLNMAQLAINIETVDNRGLVNVCALLFFIGFGIKSALFPLYFWLPDSYHTPPSAVAAIFAGLLTKVGVYALIRVFTLIFIGDAFLGDVITWVAALTLVAGAFGAAGQTNIRKLFSWLIICHIGYMVAGLGLATERSVSGAVLYLMHDIPVKTALFVVAGILYRMRGSHLFERQGGILSEYPLLSFLMAISLFSLAGVPPLSGFWPKINLFAEAIAQHDWAVLIALGIGSFLTLWLIARVWHEVFWKPSSGLTPRPGFIYFDKLPSKRRVQYVVPLVLLASMTLYLAIGTENALKLADRIASELFNRAAYIESVLNLSNMTNP
jgi:multicomponent Na+:H+ antiporter subunit D